MTSPADLPDEIDALKAMLVAAEAQIGTQNKTLAERDDIIIRKEDRIVRLEKLLTDFKRALLPYCFGNSLRFAQCTGLLDDTSTLVDDANMRLIQRNIQANKEFHFLLLDQL